MPNANYQTTKGVRFEVEWCETCPVNECGDAEIDKAQFSVSYRNSVADAKREAKMKLPLDFFGQVIIRRQYYDPSYYEPRVGAWVTDDHFSPIHIS